MNAEMFLKSKKISKPTYEGVRLVDSGMKDYRIVDLLNEFADIIRKQVNDAEQSESNCNIPVVSVSVASSDVGKCTTCKFNNGKYDNCTAGTYYAEKGLNRICYEGELWEATER